MRVFWSWSLQPSSLLPSLLSPCVAVVILFSLVVVVSQGKGGVWEYGTTCEHGRGFLVGLGFVERWEPPRLWEA